MPHLIEYYYLCEIDHGGSVEELSPRDREVVSSSPTWTSCDKSQMLKWVVTTLLSRARHLEVRIMGLLNMTLKIDVPCRSRCGT